jgi:hypothetical protein
VTLTEGQNASANALTINNDNDFVAFCKHELRVSWRKYTVEMDKLFDIRGL